MSDKNAHYAVPGHVISKLVRMIYILADRDKEQTAKLITLRIATTHIAGEVLENFPVNIFIKAYETNAKAIPLLIL